ncbi:DUF982 domain-containing protein [Pararhizobium sp. DWP1-1-3]|uniref:DUF982 domain-containing protein n=1 Tax=Pararhizobium sp. DWP1-1-3 TaxID=2804652 RepID=UPI003CF26054
MTWKPIIVHLPMAGPQTIHGPYAALIALLIDWPERRSAHHRAAMRRVKRFRPRSCKPE